MYSCKECIANKITSDVLLLSYLLINLSVFFWIYALVNVYPIYLESNSKYVYIGTQMFHRQTNVYLLVNAYDIYVVCCVDVCLDCRLDIQDGLF